MMLDVLDREAAPKAAPHGCHNHPTAPAAATAEPCHGCHFWHFGHCVHVTRYGCIGDGACRHRKDAREVL